jgi:ribonuclease-3
MLSFEKRFESIVAPLSSLDLKKIEKIYPKIYSNIEALSKIQSHRYEKTFLAATALIHRSFLVFWPKEKNGIFSNERLEFLGDSFLNYVVTLELMSLKPAFDEGSLSKLRSALVGTENLAKKSQKLKLGECLILGKTDKSFVIQNQQNILADAFEATLAALLLDGKEAKAYDWVCDNFQDDFNELEKKLLEFDAKSRLQQLTQSLANEPPTYKVIGTEGTLHETFFIVGCFMGATEVGRGVGANKRDASKKAAELVLKKIQQGELSLSYVTKLYGKTNE